MPNGRQQASCGSKGCLQLRGYMPLLCMSARRCLADARRAAALYSFAVAARKKEYRKLDKSKLADEMSRILFERYIITSRFYWSSSFPYVPIRRTTPAPSSCG